MRAKADAKIAFNRKLQDESVSNRDSKQKADEAIPAGEEAKQVQTEHANEVQEELANEARAEDANKAPEEHVDPKALSLAWLQRWIQVLRQA